MVGSQGFDDSGSAAELTRRQLLRRSAGVAGALSIPLFPAGAAAAARTAAAAGGSVAGTGGTLTWALAGNTKSLDIAHNFDISSGTPVMALGLESLVTYDNNLHVVPLLAESWSQPDPLRYVYKIRQGVKFWDGSPLTPADVAFSLRRHLDPKVGSQLSFFYASVKSIDVTGPSEVTVRLKRPDPTFRFSPVLSFITQQKHTLAQGAKFGAPGTPVTVMGTGPYVFTSYRPDQGISAALNQHYWGPKPRLFSQIEFKFIPDPVTRQLAMRSGNIDGSFDVAPEQADQWSRVGNVRVKFAEGMIVNFLSFDLSRAPWNDIHVRRAMAYALDRQGIVRALLHGRGLAANSLVPPPMWSNLLPEAGVRKLYASLPTYPFNMAKAKQELAQSSVPSGFSASVTYAATNLTLGKALLSLAENVKQLHIDLHVKEVPEDTWLSYVYAHKNLGLQAIEFLPDFPDPADYMVASLPSDQAKPNGFNAANYRNPTVTKLLVDQTGKKGAARVRDLSTVMRTIAHDLPYLPIYWVDTGMAITGKYNYTGFNPVYYYQQWVRNISPAK